MLELREYTAKELKEIYNTDRIDWIKRKVSREGYTYTGSGRGDNYTMLIESLPKSVDRFKIYCIEELRGANYESTTTFHRHDCKK